MEKKHFKIFRSDIALRYSDEFTKEQLESIFEKTVGFKIFDGAKKISDAEIEITSANNKFSLKVSGDLIKAGFLAYNLDEPEISDFETLKTAILESKKVVASVSEDLDVVDVKSRNIFYSYNKKDKDYLTKEFTTEKHSDITLNFSLDMKFEDFAPYSIVFARVSDHHTLDMHDAFEKADKAKYLEKLITTQTIFQSDEDPDHDQVNEFIDAVIIDQRKFTILERFGYESQG